MKGDWLDCVFGVAATGLVTRLLFFDPVDIQSGPVSRDGFGGRKSPRSIVR